MFFYQAQRNGDGDRARGPEPSIPPGIGSTQVRRTDPHQQERLLRRREACQEQV